MPYQKARRLLRSTLHPLSRLFDFELQLVEVLWSRGVQGAIFRSWVFLNVLWGDLWTVGGRRCLYQGRLVCIIQGSKLANDEIPTIFQTINALLFFAIIARIRSYLRVLLNKIQQTSLSFNRGNWNSEKLILVSVLQFENRQRCYKY